MTNLVVLAAASDPRPDDNNVVAGWVGFVVFLALIIAVVFILRSFTKQLKKVRQAQEAGVFDEEKPEESGDTSEHPSHQA
jgi:TRAP-type C4-dicarboxylate transport system permease small subunit